MTSRFMYGSSLLLGNNTIPGVKLTPELKKYIPVILQACRDYGLDFYPTVVELLTYDEISEIAAYGGFPVRYPHWKWGMEYEELQRGYEYQMHKIYELVINSSPCYIYCLDSNTLADHLTVVAHATGHNDFFKNNLRFQHTDTNMLNKMANHATRIKKYMARWGKEKVTEFIDHVLRIDNLIDPAKAREQREFTSRVTEDHRSYRFPKRLEAMENHLYMDPFLNTHDYKSEQRHKIKELDAADEIGVFKEPTKDILGYIRDNAPLKPWQADIVSMLYEESMYFYPQRQTKISNEGWASYIDSEIMARQGFIGLGQASHDAGIIDYAIHKAGVLGGKYSSNPYKMGYSILLDIEERWNKGRFGIEWDNCDNVHERENWDKNLGLGKEKLFEVRKNYDDYSLISEFFTEDLCRKMEFFNWQYYNTGETKFENRDYAEIKKELLKRHINAGMPDVRLTEPNFWGKGVMFLQHYYSGDQIYQPYLKDVLASINFLWKNEVYLATQNEEGNEEVHCCYGQGPHHQEILTREEFLGK